MKLRFAVAASLVISLLVLASANVAQAQWPALSSGYAVTTNWHGQEVPIGQSVTAWAGTTDSVVDEVEFRWLNPSGEIAISPPPFIPITGSFVTPAYPAGAPQEIIDWGNQHQGVTVYYTTNTQGPDVLNIIGDWGVQAIFHDSGEIMKGMNSDIVKIRGTSFEVVPEVPFGTIAILLSMFGAFGVFAIKRKHFPTKKSS